MHISHYLDLRFSANATNTLITKTELLHSQSATPVPSRSSPPSTSSKMQNQFHTDSCVSFLHFMSDTVHSYWNSSFLREEGMGIVIFTSFVHVKKSSHIFCNNENLDQVQCIVQNCIPIKLFNRVWAFPLACPTAICIQ